MPTTVRIPDISLNDLIMNDTSYNNIFNVRYNHNERPFNV